MIVTYDKDEHVLLNEIYVRLCGMPKTPGDGKVDAYKPGIRVVHEHDGRSSGIVVAVTDKGITVLWSKPPGLGFKLPDIRQVFSKLNSRDIVSVQPMTLPIGNLFYLDYQYGESDDDDNNG